MKLFLIKWCLFFAPIFGVSAYYTFGVSKQICGDIGNLTRIPFGIDYAKRIHCYELTRDILSVLVDVDSCSQYPLLLVGDSFSEPENAMGHGISQVTGDTVHVIQDLLVAPKYVPVQTLYYALANGRLKAGQTVILESIERSITDRFATELDTANTARPDLRQTQMWRNEQTVRMPRLELIRETGLSLQPFRLNDMLTWLRIKLSYQSPVVHEQLDADLFDHAEYPRDLFCYKEDMQSIDIADDMLRRIGQNVNHLFRMAQSQGVRLYLLVVPDKYDLYYPRIVGPKTTEPNIINFLQYVDDEHVINARDTLRPYVMRGEKDLFRLDDTHWSRKAADIISHKVGQRIVADRRAEAAAQSE